MENSPHQHNEEHGHNAQITPEMAIQIIDDRITALGEGSEEHKHLNYLKNIIEMDIKNLNHLVQKKDEDDFFKQAEIQLSDEGGAQPPTDDYERKIAHLQLVLRAHIEMVEELYGESTPAGAEVDSMPRRTQGIAAYVLGKLRFKKNE